MRAVARRGRALIEIDMPEPEPIAGQVAVRTLACGICGSDLHAVHHLDAVVEMGRRAGSGSRLDPGSDIVLGHEFCAEVEDYGPGTSRRLRPGTRVVSIPFTVGPQGPELVGFSNLYPGGFAERMVLMESMLLEVPNGLPSEHAAMVEPMAVGRHAVAQANLQGHPVALVIGCGPVGLAVIADLKLRGVHPIIASDYSPARRRLAARMGADVVVDPAQSSPHGHWAAFDVPATLAELRDARFGSRSVRPPVIFECVGAPGLLQAILEQGPPLAEVIVAGVCMEEDRLLPALAINKQLSLRFVFAYTPEEFAGTLADMAEGRIDVAPMHTDTVGLSGVAGAFAALGDPEGSVKIIVDPRRA